ncbi:MAG: hypothetical protein ABEH65_07065 [Halobacteriales archaeon]
MGLAAMFAGFIGIGLLMAIGALYWGRLKSKEEDQQAQRQSGIEEDAVSE